MRYLVSFFVIVVFLPFFSLFAQSGVEIEDKVITELGVITRDMPKENLANAGFNQDKLISYNAVGDQEYITFLDISLVGDNITFYLEQRIIKDWFRGTDVGTLDESALKGGY